MSQNSKPRLRIFISYSRDDTSIVGPVVQLLRVTESNVFLDIDSIEPGQKWEDELDRAVSAADKVCVFWCQHSAASNWVDREWRHAHKLQRMIIPLLLDSTPVAEELAAYQHIDFRSVVEGRTHPTQQGDFFPRAPVAADYSPDSEYREAAEQIVKGLIPLIEKE